MRGKSEGGLASNPNNDFIKKTMVLVYFICQGFLSIEILSKREEFNSAFFTLTILFIIVRGMNVIRLKNTSPRLLIAYRQYETS
jgi:hypothetical protein